MEEVDAEVLRISFTKSPILPGEDKTASVTPEMSRRSKTPRYMEVDSNVNGAYSNSPDRGFSTPRSDGRKSAALVHIDLSKRIKIQEPQRTPRLAPNTVLRLEMKPPSPRENQQRGEESPCQSPKEREPLKPRDSTPRRSDTDSPCRKVDNHDIKTGKHSTVEHKEDKDSSRQSRNVDKSKKNTKNIKERTHSKKELKKASSSDHNVVTYNKKDLKRNDSKSSVIESSVIKDKGPKGNRRSSQKTNDTKRSKSLPKTNSKKLPYDPTEYNHYSDDFDESGDASDIEEGKSTIDDKFTRLPIFLPLIFTRLCGALL